jgi:mycothiol synthase
VPVTLQTPNRLDGPERASVLELADSIEAADGAPPLSDQARSRLATDQVDHYVARSGAQIVGYAQRHDGTAEVLGQPESLDALLDALEPSGPPLHLWAHGTRSRLLPVLDARGYERERTLWQLRWTAAPLPPMTVPAGVQIRPFVVGSDEAALLAVNAAAFAHHPEQGGWTLVDVTAREGESWFDSDDVLLAERVADAGPAELIGFHWTKRHTPTLGEVYVLAVAPTAQGLHLGSTLLIAGLAHLVEAGSTEVLLYVDDSNATAVALYEKYGFRRHDHDVQFRFAG